MSLKKIYDYLGPNALSFIVDQERKHWLLKTHRQKQLVDPHTGDMYQGRVDNFGSDVFIESRKLPINYFTLQDIKYSEKFSYVFQNEPSALTYNSSMNGLVCAKIISTNFPDSFSTFHHYSIHFRNCEEVCIPFAVNNNTSEVFSQRWIKTTTPPILLLQDSTGTYSTEVPLTFSPVDKYVVMSEQPEDWETNFTNYYIRTGTGYQSIPPYTIPPQFISNAFFKKIQVEPSNLTFYYPIERDLMPLFIQHLTLEGEWYTEGVNNNDQIGLPAFWFTCDLTTVGSCIVLPSDTELFCIGNNGDASKYNAHMYVGVGQGNALDKLTPGSRSTSDTYLYVSPTRGYEFNGTASDFNVPLNPNTISMKNVDEEVFQFDYIGENTKFYMNQLSAWEYVSGTSYRIIVSTFDRNRRFTNYNKYPLIPVINIHFDESVDFGNTTTDIGFVGIRGGSGNPESDIYEKYPYTLNKFDGLPEHLTNPNPEDPQEHMAVYAIHNTPSYVETDPNTRQTAALLLDPGRAQHPENLFYYDFYWPFPPDNINYNMQEPLPPEFANDRFFFHITDPSYDLDYEKTDRIKGESYAMLNCYHYENNEFTPIVQIYLFQTNGNFNENFGAKDFVYHPSPLDPHFSQLHWTNPKNTKEDGTGIEYIDINHVQSAAAAGAKVEEDLGLRFRIYRNLDLDEANYTRGRVYVISNDPSEYDNNVTSPMPKPARTAARICDIPTSIAQLSGITNVAPTYVVDERYVRTEASYTEADRNRVYNVNSTKWVRPIHLDINEKPVKTDNDFVFKSVDQLNQVDLISHNEFRYMKQLVPMVDPADVSIANIIKPGEGYATNDFGYVYIGGFGFEYHVSEVDPHGAVIGVNLSYPELTDNRKINLSNFNMVGQGSAYTATYGTTPKTGNGGGLKLQLYIDNFDSIQTYKGGVYTDLFALVREPDGLWLYTYNVIDTGVADDNIHGTWVKNTQISQFEDNSADANYLSTADAFMTSIMPIIKTTPCCVYGTNMGVRNLGVSSTASFVQVVSESGTCIQNATSTVEYNRYDLTKWYCDGLITLTNVTTMTHDAVLEALSKVTTIRSDCYIAWRPDNALDPSNHTVIAGIIYRSFNNLRSDAVSTTLPQNGLTYQKYVNSNANTTIAWDVPNIGPMVWVFNPKYHFHEIYKYDENANQLLIDREMVTWENVEINSNNIYYKETLVDENHKLKYNIITNNLFHQGASSHIDQSTIYAQPSFFEVAIIGMDVSTASLYINPTGNWQCVFPRVSRFTFKHGTDPSASYSPIEMNLVNGVNVSPQAHVFDDTTKADVSTSTVIFENTANGTIMKLFNPVTQTWEKI